VIEVPLQVVVVDDDRLLRDSLRILLDGSSGFACAGSYGSVEEAMGRLAASTSEVDVILLDVGLPGRSGAASVGELRQLRPGAEVVMFTVHDDDEQIFASLCDGACGYLLKDTPVDRLLGALREAGDGGAPMSAAVARRVIALFRRLAPPPGNAEHDLTGQELRLLGLLAEGHTYQGVAERLAISKNTVRSHVRKVYEKLHVHSRSQAVHQALRRGIL
jgi:DNA-binding NarL/FixJ family response regulator